MAITPLSRFCASVFFISSLVSVPALADTYYQYVVVSGVKNRPIPNPSDSGYDGSGSDNNNPQSAFVTTVNPTYSGASPFDPSTVVSGLDNYFVTYRPASSSSMARDQMRLFCDEFNGNPCRLGTGTVRYDRTGSGTEDGNYINYNFTRSYYVPLSLDPACSSTVGTVIESPEPASAICVPNPSGPDLGGCLYSAAEISAGGSYIHTATGVSCSYINHDGSDAPPDPVDPVPPIINPEPSEPGVVSPDLSEVTSNQVIQISNENDIKGQLSAIGSILTDSRESVVSAIESIPETQIPDFDLEPVVSAVDNQSVAITGAISSQTDAVVDAINGVSSGSGSVVDAIEQQTDEINSTSESIFSRLLDFFTDGAPTQGDIDLQDGQLNSLRDDRDFSRTYDINFGSKTCPQPIRIYLSTLKTDIEISFSMFCQFAGIIRNLVMLSAYIAAIFITLGLGVRRA